tara:strand:- start:4521 stop:5645 length:1125 start_codon:yes stop_codon:yes gene_type:complete
MRGLKNIFWLGTKEFRSFFSDAVLVILLIWSFTLSIYSEATGSSESVNNASIGIVDEDRSALSQKIATALYPPYFRIPVEIQANEIDAMMDQSRYMFVLVIPRRFEADLRMGRTPTVQLNIDATAVAQAGLGAEYLQNIIEREVMHYLQLFGDEYEPMVGLTTRRAFNANGSDTWFFAINAILNNLSILTIILTGAALLREREHGTIEHLLVMPLTPFQIALAKVWANGLVILIGFALSMFFMVEGLLDVPIAGSRLLLLLGATVYLFAAAAIGILLGTLARTMAQFALLIMLTIMPMMMLSGGMSPIENQPDFLRPITWFLPSRHFMAFSQAVIFRGATLEAVWPVLATMAGLGFAFFAASLMLFRRSITLSR